MDNLEKPRKIRELKTFQFRDPKTGEIKPTATKEDMAFIDQATGKVIVKDEDADLYRYMEGYGLKPEDFILENDPEGRYEIKYYQRTYFDKLMGETITMKCKARVNKATGKIELTGFFADTDELYANRIEYGLKDDDFEFMEK